MTIYNNVCCKFDDVIISKVKGLPDVEFPVSISITGSPVVIPLNQVGLNYNTIPATLPMPTVVCKTKQVVKHFMIKNTGIKGVQIDWKIFDRKKGIQAIEDNSKLKIHDPQPTPRDFFDIDIVKNYSFDKTESPFKVEYNIIEPEPAVDSAFKIEPETALVGSRSSHSFTVTFDPSKGTGNFKSLILASPELTKDELEI